MEKRNHIRFLTEPDVLIEVRPYSIVVGHLLDISMDGLSFCYVDTGNRLEAFSDINMWINNELFLKDLRVRRIYDFELHSENNVKQFLAVRQCGVQFMYLMQYHESRLIPFFQNCTVDDVRHDAAFA